MIVDGLGKDLDSITSFLMIGQSNMAGRGDFGEVEPISNPMCYMLRMGRWQRMSEPINPDRAIFDTFREIQETIPNCSLVSSKDLMLKPDGLHFNSLALREFGNRYFDKYLDFTNEI